MLLSDRHAWEYAWKFDKAGTVSFACLVPGHMEAGMVGEVVVK
ncbi:plastocyanin/azurin family copper-binding protein [Aeromonas hydrophila]